MKEVIKIIEENICFHQLPKDIQKSWIKSMAKTMILDFDEGIYNMKTAIIDAKKYYLDWEKDRKYFLFHSNFHGIGADEQNRINDI